MNLRKMSLAGLALAVTGVSASAPAANVIPIERFGHVFGYSVCGHSSPLGFAHCHAKVVTDSRGVIFAGKPNALNPRSVPSGYGPADIQAAYGLGATTTTALVAIVDAYGYTNAASDLATYRAQYGLPPCTKANGCLQIVDQNGGTNLPRQDTGWAQEAALDLDMVSASCPTCRIVLVQASSNSLANLGKAVNTAVALGAKVVSNSYGGGEYSGETSDEVTYYKHPGVAITVSSGDNGYGSEFPAASQYVTAVGGTSLTKSNGSYSETAWNGAGSGCSAYVTKPSWQSVITACAKRAIADVSAVADPNTGVAVFGPTSRRTSGWMVFGGTSVASPVIGGIYARAGGVPNYGGDPYAKGTSSNLHDVTVGSNGTCSTVVCHAAAGWDGPTGLGTPNGTTAF